MQTLEELRKEWEKGLKLIDELRVDENKLIVVLRDSDGDFYVYTYLNFTGGNAPGWGISCDANGESPFAAFKALFRRLR